MPDPAQGGGTGGAVNPPAGTGGPSTPPAVDMDALARTVVTSLEQKVADMVTGAVKRNVASALDGLDLDALKKASQPNPDPDPDKGKKPTVLELQAELGELKKRDSEREAREQVYRQRALRGEIDKIVLEAKVHPHARSLLSDHLAAIVQEDDKGNLFVKINDDVKPLGDYLTAHLKDKPALLESAARPGSGAGSTGTGWNEAMPTTMRELLVDPKTGKDTPERWDAFVAAHPDEAAMLRAKERRGFQGGIAGRASPSPDSNARALLGRNK